MDTISSAKLLVQAEQAGKAGDLDQAIQIYFQTLKLFPANSKVKNGLIAIRKMRKIQELDAALVSRMRLLAEQGAAKSLVLLAYETTKRTPRSDYAWMMLGLGLKIDGRFADADRALMNAIRLDPASAHHHYNYGLLLQEQANLESAALHYKFSIALDAKFYDAQNNLGLVYQAQSQVAKAKQEWQALLAKRPKHVDAMVNLGSLYMVERDAEKALTWFQKAARLSPDNDLVLSNLLEVYEKTNRLAEMESLVEDYLSAEKIHDSKIKLQIGSFYFRTKKYQSCHEILAELDLSDAGSDFLLKFHELNGKSLEKLSKYEEAFESFSALNSISRAANSSYEAPCKIYLEELETAAKQIQNLPVSKPKLKAGAKEPPAFMVGFPRSGTTLLDTFLRGNSATEVIEEKEMINTAWHGQAKIFDYHSIEALGSDTLADIRNAYEVNLAGHCEDRNRLIVDKLPLNLVRIAEILHIYPKSKIVLSLRHPLDCVLSNFKQNYVINKSMFLMTDVDAIARFYDASMQIFWNAVDRYQVDVFTLKYENLISNTEPSLREVSSYLGLDFEPDMLNHQKTAAGRDKINTPSYSQVVQPIYLDSQFAWKSYRAQLQPVVAKLEPWIERYDYTV